ncbi:MAG: hypothetical protein O7A07_02510 [Acidobacteria bacterium]|nr:hypothetical protein [Acidobacteriota bacterium]
MAPAIHGRVHERQLAAVPDGADDLPYRAMQQADIPEVEYAAGEETAEGRQGGGQDGKCQARRGGT